MNQLLEKKYDKLELDIEKFINNFICNCNNQIIFDNGQKICKHLIKEKNKRFRKKIIKLTDEHIKVLKIGQI